MRQNGTTISLLLDCVSYEILRETRIKPSFFGNCLIFLSPAGGPVPGLSIRANGSSLPLVLIKRIAHVRGGCTPGNSRQGTAAERRVCANH